MIWQSRLTPRLWQKMRCPKLRVLSAATGLCPSALSRLKAIGIDLCDGPALVDRYSKRRRGRKPKATAPIVHSPEDVLAALRALNAAANHTAKKD